MTPILEDLPFSSGDRVLAFVNGMGGTPLIELYVDVRGGGEDRARSTGSRSSAT